jgi:hypothetical protein
MVDLIEENTGQAFWIAASRMQNTLYQEKTSFDGNYIPRYVYNLHVRELVE